MIKSSKQITKYVIGDFISSNVAILLFNLFRYYRMGKIEFNSLDSYLAYPRVIEGQIFFPLLCLTIFYLSGYYNRPFFKSRLQEFFGTIFSIFVSVLFIFFVALINDMSRVHLDNYELLLAIFLILFCCIYPMRAIITQVATNKIHNRQWGFNTLIIGTGHHATNLAVELRQMKKSLGYQIIGFVQTEKMITGQLEGENIYKLEELADIINREDVRELIVSLDRSYRHTVHKTINLLYPLGLPIQLQSDDYEMIMTRVKLSNIYGTPLVDITNCSLSDCEKNLKRGSDILISALALILLSPLFLFLSVKIKCSSTGPIFYQQERIGYRKKPFYLYKFRTMKTNAEAEGPALSTENDPRITSFGRIMRKYRLDELPQFWNVLKGDMSLVGPRPEREFFINQILQKAPYYSLLHQIRPGITSWGMVKFGYARDINEMIKRLRYDIIYLENMSLLVDFKIIIYTIKTVFTGKGI